MKKKATKRTHEDRVAAAKLAWKNRRAKAAAALANPTPWANGVPKNFKSEFIKKPSNGTALSKLLPMATPGYEALANELLAAYAQSAHGKGVTRHGNGRSFDHQPIAEISRAVGVGFPTGQALKKTGEAVGMFERGEVDAAIAELHGAIVYLAAAAHRMRG
jgi:hypothetical protein